MKNIGLFVLTAVAIAGGVRAEVVQVYDSNAVIPSGGIYETVVVEGDGTVVEMMGA